MKIIIGSILTGKFMWVPMVVAFIAGNIVVIFSLAAEYMAFQSSSWVAVLYSVTHSFMLWSIVYFTFLFLFGWWVVGQMVRRFDV